MKDLAEEVRKNATDVIEAVYKTSEDFSSVMDQIKDALKQITILQVTYLIYNIQESESKGWHSEVSRLLGFTSKIKVFRHSCVDFVHSDEGFHFLFYPISCCSIQFRLLRCVVLCCVTLRCAVLYCVVLGGVGLGWVSCVVSCWVGLFRLGLALLG